MPKLSGVVQANDSVEPRNMGIGIMKGLIICPDGWIVEDDGLRRRRRRTYLDGLTAADGCREMMDRCY